MLTMACEVYMACRDQEAFGKIKALPVKCVTAPRFHFRRSLRNEVVEGGKDNPMINNLVSAGDAILIKLYYGNNSEQR